MAGCQSGVTMLGRCASHVVHQAGVACSQQALAASPHPGVGVVEGHPRDLQSGHLVRSCTQDTSLGSAALLLHMRLTHSMHHTGGQIVATHNGVKCVNVEVSLAVSVDEAAVRWHLPDCVSGVRRPVNCRRR